MRVAVAGGTGNVGRFVVMSLLREGHAVTVLSRRPPAPGELPGAILHRPFQLDAPGEGALEGAEALVHAAFDHVPGRYRGGEGSDPAGFVSRNLGGTISLFRAAQAAGVPRIVFLSSRAVYGGYPEGTPLSEGMAPRPDTLYGHVKREGEAALGRLDAAGVSLRVTGVYGPAGPGREHKWAPLFRDFASGAPIDARAGTEVHGEDVAAAVALFLRGRPRSGVFNVSDLIVDRADLVAEFSRLTGIAGSLPERADPRRVSVMSTDRLRGEGWAPRGGPGLTAALERMCRGWEAPPQSA